MGKNRRSDEELERFAKEIIKSLGGQIDNLKKQFENLEGRFEKRFESLESGFEKRFESLESGFEKRFESLESSFGSLEKRFEYFEYEMEREKREIYKMQMQIEQIANRGGETNFGFVDSLSDAAAIGGTPTKINPSYQI